MDRFDLEQSILAAWSVVDDIRLVAGRADSATNNELLLAIAAIANLKFEKLFDVFETLVSLKKI